MSPPSRSSSTGENSTALDILPALKRVDSSAGQRAGPVSPLATSRLPNGVRRGDTGFVRDTSAPGGVWRIRRPFGRGIRLHRASRSSRRDGGDAPGRRFPCVRARAVPSACLPFMPRWAGTIEQGSLFDCRVATASETSARERCGGLRRPGGPQSNRQCLPVVRPHKYAVEGINSGGCRPVVGFIPAVNGEAFSLTLRNRTAGAGYRRDDRPAEMTAPGGGRVWLYADRFITFVHLSVSSEISNTKIGG